jgi:hypothetical protein
VNGLSTAPPDSTTLPHSAQAGARTQCLSTALPPADTRLVFGSRFMPCDDCGASLAHDERANHLCERERWLDYQVFQLREELAAYDSQLSAYLASPQGRFALWYAARLRSQADPGPPAET